MKRTLTLQQSMRVFRLDPTCHILVWDGNERLYRCQKVIIDSMETQYFEGHYRLALPIYKGGSAFLLAEEINYQTHLKGASWSDAHGMTFRTTSRSSLEHLLNRRSEMERSILDILQKYTRVSLSVVPT